MQSTVYPAQIRRKKPRNHILKMMIHVKLFFYDLSIDHFLLIHGSWRIEQITQVRTIGDVGRKGTSGRDRSTCLDYVVGARVAGDYPSSKTENRSIDHTLYALQPFHYHIATIAPQSAQRAVLEHPSL